ncbi:MAG TPA: DNA photolyase, partial [Gammaproteobacteria bacterium]
FSFTPDVISRALEHKVPRLEKRIHAMRELQQQGWRVGLRFDPLIYCEDYPTHYRQLFKQVFQALDPQAIHSISFGPFRLPKPFQQNIVRLYPDEALFAGRFEEHNGMVSYPRNIETEMSEFCRTEILQYVPEEKLFPCSI